MLLELRRIGQPPLRRDAERHVDPLRHRLVAEPAGRGLRVLLAHGGRDVGRRQAELREPIRLQPDAHRVVARAEHLHVADARNAPQLVDDVDRGVVRDEQIVVAAVRRIERDHLQEARQRSSRP